MCRAAQLVVIFKGINSYCDTIDSFYGAVWMLELKEGTVQPVTIMQNSLNAKFHWM